MAEDKRIPKEFNGEYMELLRKTLKEALFYDDWQACLRFVNKFGVIMEKNPELIPQQFQKELAKFIIQAKWPALPSLEDSSIIDLFKNHFSVQYDLPGGYYNLWDKLRAKLITIGMYDKRDEFRAEIKRALLENEEEIVSKGPIDNQGKFTVPSVKNWLIDYNKNMGEKESDTIKINEYIAKNTVINKLPEEEKEKLKKLFNFFEILKISSLDPRGYEETISVIDDKWGPGIVEAGRFVPKNKNEIEDMKKFIRRLKELDVINKDYGTQIDNNEVTTEVREEESMANRSIAQVPQPLKNEVEDEIKEAETGVEEKLHKAFDDFWSGELMRKVIEAKESLENETGGDMGKIRGKFYHSVNNRGVEGAVAALMSLADSKQIGEAFGEDERFIKFWGSYLEKNNLDKERFNNDPANGADMANFFKYILEKRLDLSDNESVMIGVTLSNLAREAGETEYNKMAYGDMNDGKFKWNI